VIRLSRLSDYGIVLMAFLAEQPAESQHSARGIAQGTRLPLPVVSKILKALAREGLLLSQRGSRGGYALARRPDSITVAEMLTALEGPIGLTECTCPDGGAGARCVRKPWQQINHRAARSPALTLALAAGGSR
jgi:Rrf2 family protein